MKNYIYFGIAIALLCYFIFYYNVYHIYYFYTDTCPYCKEMNPEFDKAKSSVGCVGYIYHKIDINKKENAELAGKYSVRSVPTLIKVICDGSFTEYKGIRKATNIANWIK